MSGCYLDTTIVADISADKKPSRAACEKAIGEHMPAQLPYYALRELLTGYVRNLCDLHNVINAAQDLGEALQTLAIRSQREGVSEILCVSRLMNHSLNTNRSSNWMASCALAACHEIGGFFQFSVMWRSASQISFVAA